VGKISITVFSLLKLEMRALCSQTLKKEGIFKTIFGFPFLDIYKCPELISLFTFGKKFVTDT
jgi:hypothetical protein